MSIMQKIDGKQQMIIVDCDNVDESEANISHLIGAGYKVAGTHYAWIPECAASAYVVYMVLGDDMLRAELAAGRKSFAIIRNALDIAQEDQDRAQNAYLAEREFLTLITEHLAIANANMPTPRVAHVLGMLVDHLAQPE